MLGLQINQPFQETHVLKFDINLSPIEKVRRVLYILEIECWNPLFVLKCWVKYIFRKPAYMHVFWRKISFCLSPWFVLKMQQKVHIWNLYSTWLIQINFNEPLLFSQHISVRTSFLNVQSPPDQWAAREGGQFYEEQQSHRSPGYFKEFQNWSDWGRVFNQCDLETLHNPTN